MRLYGKAPSPKGVRLYTRSMHKGSNIFYILLYSIKGSQKMNALGAEREAIKSKGIQVGV